ncbi:MAG: hypothetical protein H0V63_02700, partial [Burkholderiaceae bacterium]|nr:hypothetical protein [Burkholderiaceae bacterium]
MGGGFGKPAAAPGAKPKPDDDEAGMAKSLQAQGMSAKTAAELARLAYGDAESAD